ncbi:MAG: type II toxin-antitoxin system HipA family toxin [Micropruina sp.]|nr:type II toxin-antitoxin system HipA family toxin [Micropruina sp.]
MRRYDVHTTVAGHTVLAGTITVSGYGDRAVTDFKYDPAYMYNPDSFDLAPSVRRIVGEYTTRQLPFFLQDAGPDRWGTHLIQRSFEAHRVGRNPDDLDCVVAASDRARQGALRLSDDDGNWVGDDEIPIHTELVDLLEAADQVAAHTDSWDAYAALLRTGTSALGGARAKASVTAEDGQLWIAKFPMEADRWDIPVWEKTALDLAERAGFTVPQTRLVQVAGRNVLMLKRFDRDGATRIPYLSMRTLLNNPDDGGRAPDYRDIATSLRHFGGEDLPDLYRRAAFGVLINNTDDHLRNHGLLRIDGTWRLAPMFDVNPEQETGRERHTRHRRQVHPARRRRWPD